MYASVEWIAAGMIEAWEKERQFAFVLGPQKLAQVVASEKKAVDDVGVPTTRVVLESSSRMFQLNLSKSLSLPLYGTAITVINVLLTDLPSCKE